MDKEVHFKTCHKSVSNHNKSMKVRQKSKIAKGISFGLYFTFPLFFENRLVASLRTAINKLDLFLLFLFPIKFLFVF